MVLVAPVRTPSGERVAGGAVDVFVDAGDLIARHLGHDARREVGRTTVEQPDVQVVLLHEPAVDLVAADRPVLRLVVLRTSQWSTRRF